MPHVIVKFYSGRSDEEKRVMADAMAATLHETMGYEVGNVSVSVEEVEKADWMGKVYEPDIVQRQDQLVKRPGYGHLAG
ncbi:tautomerase family protein [Glacieibacterium frigidum]|uniref:4-oxalocrotonate tautomerase n=1 Tax=Glacieibacterium frigidum TaxID=2593303 RepID=A0A552U8E1_9SPHN|nr:tautomerase family protein [Glacieibacterium frigidum]TRW14488.1 4-oxalocrotonate tautomerase [Glacieibacterium frigidum]